MVTTTDKVDLLPTATFPKERLEGAALSGSLLTAFPWTPILRLVFEAVLVTVTLPLFQPAEPGVNVIVALTVWPAARTTGRVIPEMLNAELLAVSADTVALVFPLFVKVTVCARDWETSTAPKLRFVGELRNC